MPRAPELVVVGGGILGLAMAYTALRRRPTLHVQVLEKEPKVATHQTGHNSGVIHSGVYYRPGSLKARLCVQGRLQMLQYLDHHQIPFRMCGKVIVATNARERVGLAEIERRAHANGVPGLRRLDAAELRVIEPCVRGSEALHVPGTAIVDYRIVSEHLRADIEAMGGEVRTGVTVRGLRPGDDGVDVRTTAETLPAQYVVNAGGLHADELARTAGASLPGTIIPFRGEYYLLRPSAEHLVRGLIYPVPDPDLPFLGVHLTTRITGHVEAGPNAVLALAREGYRKSDLDVGELTRTLTYPGLPRMARRFWRTAAYELFRSLDRASFARDLRRMVPELVEDDLAPGGAGVRAQAVRPDGRPVDDFLLIETPQILHVLNAPSPGATSSLAIAEHLVERMPIAR